MKKPDFCKDLFEFNVIEKIVEVYVTINEEHIKVRIEAYYDSNNEYSVNVYQEENVTLQPTYPQTSQEYDKKPEDMEIWIRMLPFPDILPCATADDAITQALGHLQEISDKV